MITETTPSLNEISREQFRVAAAEALIATLSADALVNVIAHGFDEYVRIARPIYDGHAFHTEDYAEMFHRLVARARAKGLIQ